MDCSTSRKSTKEEHENLSNKKKWGKLALHILEIVGKVISFPSVVFIRVILRHFYSFIFDLSCLFFGPRKLYESTKPKKFRLLIFALKVIALEIYNIIVLILNATLGFFYNLIEGFFMIFNLWTQDTVEVKNLYQMGDNVEDWKKTNINPHLYTKFMLGQVDIKNKMSDFVNKLCEWKFIKGMFSIAKLLAGKFVSIGSASVLKTVEVEAQDKSNEDIDTKNIEDINAPKMSSIDLIFSPIKTFRA